MSAIKYPNGAKIRHNAAVSECVRSKREELGITRKQLCARIDVTESHYSKMEDGYQAFAIFHLACIAEEFDCSLDDLVPVLVDQ